MLDSIFYGTGLGGRRSPGTHKFRTPSLFGEEIEDGAAMPRAKRSKKKMARKRRKSKRSRRKISGLSGRRRKTIRRRRKSVAGLAGRRRRRKSVSGLAARPRRRSRRRVSGLSASPRRRRRTTRRRRTSRRRMSGLGSRFFGSRFFGKLNLKGSIGRIFAQENLTALGASTLGYIGGQVISGLVAKFARPKSPHTPQVIGAFGGAALGAVIGQVIFKSARIADMAAVANLTLGVQSLVNDRLNGVLKSMGLGYEIAVTTPEGASGIGLFMPEEVAVAGMGQLALHMPENMNIAALNAPAETMMEEELTGEADGIAFGAADQSPW